MLAVSFCRVATDNPLAAGWPLGAGALWADPMTGNSRSADKQKAVIRLMTILVE
jgi:predicted lipoprotein